jgi:flagellar FliJ protein
MVFEFSLEAVLDHRRTLEDQAQRAFSEVQSSIHAMENQQRVIQQDLTARRAEINLAMQSGQTWQTRELSENWIRVQKHRDMDLAGQIAERRKELEVRRKELVKVMQAREVMEKLREEALEQWMIEQHRAEQKVYDEIAIRDFYMNRRDAADSAKDSVASERFAS